MLLSVLLNAVVARGGAVACPSVGYDKGFARQRLSAGVLLALEGMEFLRTSVILLIYAVLDSDKDIIRLSSRSSSVSLWECQCFEDLAVFSFPT